MSDTSGRPLLALTNLKVSFRTERGLVRAVDGVSFTIGPGEVLGVVGESGSGKSVTMLAALGLIRDPNVVISGSAMYKGRELIGLPGGTLTEIRGAEIAMIFQDPMSSLTPVYQVGWQIAEQIRAHQQVSRRQAQLRAVELLRAVGIPDAPARASDYPHQFSGGMRQRVMIAMALSCNPELLIADEPTTALDVTIQAQILDLLRRFRGEFRTSVILITHDMGVMAELADRIVVMYAGRVVESAHKRALFRDPQHPYTWGLLASTVRITGPRPETLPTIPGRPPSPTSLPAGCSFAPRCSHRFSKCDEAPELIARLSEEHVDACHLSLAAKQEHRMGDSAPGPA